MSALVRNEQVKLAANAANNLGIASLVTGVIAPTAGYLLGSLQADEPLRLLAFIMIWVIIGGSLLVAARKILEGLV